MRKTITLFSILLICFASFGQTHSLTLSFAGETTECNSSQSYFVFNIIAASDPGTIFDSCVIDITCNPSAFGTWICNNNAVLCTPASSNYRAVVNNLTSSEIQIGIGSIGNSLQNGTQLTTNGTDVLVTVKIPIKNCQTSTLSFMPNQMLGMPISYYAEATTPTIGDSLYISSYPCGTDSTCHDTLHYPVTIYNYQSIPYNYNTYGTSDINSIACPPHLDQIDSYLTINAGTNASDDILTLTGNGFGISKGIIQVPDANHASNFSYIKLDTSDYTWSENQIQIKMPSVMFGTQHLMTPGTGTIKVINVCGDADSSQTIYIKYSIKNSRDYSETYKLRENIVKANRAPGSYIFRCDSASMANNPLAKICINKAIQVWNCYTGVNWVLGNDTTVNVALPPLTNGVSVIYFSNGNFPSDSTLMVTFLQNQNPCHSNTNAFIKEADINIRQDLIPAGYATWNYDDSTLNNATGNVAYFYDAILHELGHAFLLNHVNNPGDLMYWQQTNQRVNLFSGSALSGAFDVTAASQIANTCGDSIFIKGTIGCIDSTLSIPFILNNEYNFDIFPNPSDGGYITIAYQINNSAYVQFKIMDYTGRELLAQSKEKKSAGTYSELININDFAKGVYIFIININEKYKTVKFIKL